MWWLPYGTANHLIFSRNEFSENILTKWVRPRAFKVPFSFAALCWKRSLWHASWWRDAGEGARRAETDWADEARGLCVTKRRYCNSRPRSRTASWGIIGNSNSVEWIDSLDSGQFIESIQWFTSNRSNIVLIELKWL